MIKHVNILGIRGIPAAHGGFETFAAGLAPYLRKAGWDVSVYCQGEEGSKSPRAWNDRWNGIQRFHFDTYTKGKLATIEFDLRTVLHVLRQPGVDLVLGYNTAIFNVLQKLWRRKFAMNMDGIEWKRAKWGTAAKVWFWMNEWIGAHICTVPVADHPEIAAHVALRGRKGSVMIPYGSATVKAAPTTPLQSLDVEPKKYFISICRLEPENSILETVQGFVAANTGLKFVVLGNLDPLKNPYHAQIHAAANADVIFPGAIYNQATVQALRFHCLAYVHGHQVGGTNPSLVEALGAGNPVIANDNKFNRWTQGEGQLYFKTVEECSAAFAKFVHSPKLAADCSAMSYKTHQARFELDSIHQQYEKLLSGLMQ